MDLEVLNIAADTENNRNIEKRTHISKLKNSLCGDEMQIELVIKNKKILDFGYQGKSCIYCQASASLLSKISMNNQIAGLILPLPSCTLCCWLPRHGLRAIYIRKKNNNTKSDRDIN